MTNPAPSQPWETHGVGVTVYRDGRLLGIHVSLGNSLQTSLERAALKAWAAAGLASRASSAS